MASSNRDTSNYVRSTYRRSSTRRPSYGRSKSQGQVWSIIIVLLLIVILAGGAVWIYLSRQGEGAEVASTSETLTPPAVAEPEPVAEEEISPAVAEEETPPAVVAEEEVPPPFAEEEIASTAPATTPEGNLQEEEDEFAAILAELGIKDTEEEAAGAEAGTSEAAPTPAEEEIAIGVAPEEEIAIEAAPEEEIEVTFPQEQPEVMAQEGIEMPTTQERPEVMAQEETGETVAILPEDIPAAPTTPLAEEGEIVPPTPNIVTVQPGDTLSIIAQRVYGDPGMWRLIYEANLDQLDNPDRILAGMELIIPPARN